jgi:hypothetical protein
MLDRSLSAEFESYRKTLSTEEVRRAFDERVERLLSRHGVDYVRGYVDALRGCVGANLADDEEHVLRCLGAALMMQWNTLPTKLRTELFDNAGSMGETAALREQIACFLHKHKNDKDTAAT